MDDHMIDLVAGEAILRRRLESYADLRLSPDPAATARMRARVLAHAHRRADFARADAALTVVAPTVAPAVTGATVARPGRPTARWRGMFGLVAAAALLLALAGGAAAASTAGGALYGARLWVETITLPSDPSARAIAELGRLDERLREADAATRNGDTAAATSALDAYERILEEASAGVLAADDPVGAAAFEAGVARNVEVLTALVERLPASARSAIGPVIERAIEHSGRSIDLVDKIEMPGRDAGGGTTAKPTTGPHPDATDRPHPTRTSTPPTSHPGVNGENPNKGTQDKTDKPTKPDKPAPTQPPRPGHTPGNGKD
jgi:hypothetical protein